MYTVSEITTFDEDKQLYETHIGFTPAEFQKEVTPNCIAYNDVEMELLLSAWGKTEKLSRQLATGTVKRLNLIFDETGAKLEEVRKSPNTKAAMVSPNEPVKR